MKKIFYLAIAALSMTSLKMDAQNMRLTAAYRSYYINGWAPYDSSYFKYPSNYGGTDVEFGNGSLKADSTFVLLYSGGNYAESKIEKKFFDNQGRVTEKVVYNYVNSAYEPGTRYEYTYDGSGNILSELTQTHDGTAWVNTNLQTKAYDTNDNMISFTLQFWVNNAWQNSSASVYNFDNADNMLTYKILYWNTGTSQWDSSSYNRYFYTNNLQDSVYGYTWQAGWVPDSRYYLQYDVNDDNTFRLYQYWDAGIADWKNSGRNYTTYSNHYSIMDTSERWYDHLNGWRLRDRYSFSYNTDWNWLAYRLQSWDTVANVFVNQILDSNIYNGIYKIENKSYTWDANTNTYGAVNYDRHSRFYYEPFTADVKLTTKEAGELELFPVPASGRLNIDMKWNKEQDFKLAIYDMQGRLVSQTGEKATPHFRKSVSLSGLPAGTYILNIKGVEASVSRQFTVVN